MLKPAGSLKERLVAGLILSARRYAGPDHSLAMSPLEIDADHAIAFFLEKTYNLRPTSRIIPIFTLEGTLRGNADVRLSQRSRINRQHNLRRLFSRVDAKDVASGVMEPYAAEIARHAILYFMHQVTMKI